MMQTDERRTKRSDERGIAMVMALLMVLAVSVLTSAMVLVARTESLSSMSYTSMSQVRYGAESGVHAAANHLLHTYVPPSTAAEFMDYDMTVSPVTFGVGGPAIVLSSDPAVPSVHPDQNVIDAFALAATDTLNVTNGSVVYNARATLRSMRQLTDAFTGLPVTLQKWEISGTGRVAGSAAALVEVTAVIERQPVSVYRYAAFATFPGCNALSFAGGATTWSYDSALPVVAGVPGGKQDTGGNVGTNGNLDGNGNPTTINGTLSTPQAGLGNCTTNNVTAATIAGFATVEEGLVTLPQAVSYPTPPDPNPVPPTTDTGLTGGDCTVSIHCTSSGGVSTITPPTSTSVVPLGNVELNGGAEIHLNAGIYHINSLKLNGKSKIVVDSGPVIIKVMGTGETTPIDLSGGGVSNPSLDPSQLQFLYGGTGNIKMTGGADTAALVFAPNASASLSGGQNFYGSIITSKVTATGGSELFYDRRLANTVMTPGNHTMTAFTWRSF